MVNDSLRLFRSVAELRNLSRAAALHGCTVSAVSQQMQEWERVWATPLLDRSQRPLVVTAAGQAFLSYCRDVLRREDELRTALAGLREEPEIVRVASIYSVGLPEMSRLEAALAVAAPTAQLIVEYGRPERVYAAVREDRADLGLVSYPAPSREIAARPWRNEEMVVVTHPQQPLARRETIAAAELDGEPFVGFEEELPISREINRYLRSHGATVRMILRFDNIEMIKEAVAHGKGVSIVPARVLSDEQASGRLVAIPLEPPLYRPVGIIHRKRKRFSPAGQTFLSLLAPPV